MSNFSDSGFTLIEILVVLGILVLISGIFIVNINLERQTSALLRSSQKLSLDLRRAQNYSLSAKKFKTNGVPCGWGMHFGGSGSTSYIIFADLAVNPNCSDRDFIRAADGSEDFETVNFDAGISINSLSSGLTDIVFTPPGPTVSFTPDQASVTISLINKNGSTKIINVNKVGLISIQ